MDEQKKGERKHILPPGVLETLTRLHTSSWRFHPGRQEAPFQRITSGPHTLYPGPTILPLSLRAHDFRSHMEEKLSVCGPGLRNTHMGELWRLQKLCCSVSLPLYTDFIYS